MTIAEASRADLPAILALQYLAYQSEARLLNNPDIPPLRQTLEEVEAELDKGKILKAVEEGEIVGSVRGYVEDGTLHVGKLIVHPHRQGRGVGTRLLEEIEQACSHRRCELFTSSISQRNIRLYRRAGYREFDERPAGSGLTMVYLEKPAGARDPSGEER